MKQKIIMGWVIVLVLGFMGTAAGQKNKPELEVKEKNIIKSATKEVTGEVSAISKDFIAIVYSWDKEKGAVPFFPFSLFTGCNIPNWRIHKRNKL